MTESVVSGNSAGNLGGGIYAGSVNVTGSTVDGNVAAFRGGGIFASNGIIDASTISNSSAVDGGGAYLPDATLTNVTISGNTAERTGGGLYALSTISATNITVTGNTAGGGGGLDIGNVGNQSTLTNSVVTGNKAIAWPDIKAPSGYNLAGNNIIGTDVFSGSTDIGDTTASDVFAQTIDIGGGVFAGVLADNGGPVQTVALKASDLNPAIDTANGSAPARTRAVLPVRTSSCSATTSQALPTLAPSSSGTCSQRSKPAKLSKLPRNTSTASPVKVLELVIDDPDGNNTFTFSGPDAAFFELLSDGVYLKAGTALDFERKQAFLTASSSIPLGFLVAASTIMFSSPTSMKRPRLSI